MAPGTPALVAPGIAPAPGAGVPHRFVSLPRFPLVM
jgi:hypothetical protein